LELIFYNLFTQVARLRMTKATTQTARKFLLLQNHAKSPDAENFPV